MLRSLSDETPEGSKVFPIWRYGIVLLHCLGTEFPIPIPWEVIVNWEVAGSVEAAPVIGEFPVRNAKLPVVPV